MEHLRIWNLPLTTFGLWLTVGNGNCGKRNRGWGGGAPRWHPGCLRGCPEGTARPPCCRRVQRGVSSHRQAPRVLRELTLPAGRGPSPWVSPERVQCTPVEGPGLNLPRKWWPSDLASLLQTSPLSPPPGHRPLVLGPATELHPARPHASTASLHRQPPPPASTPPQAPQSLLRRLSAPPPCCEGPFSITWGSKVTYFPKWTPQATR